MSTITTTTTTTSDDDDALQKELSSLRIFRATLQSVKQLVEGIHNDAATAAANCKAATRLEERWGEVIEANMVVAPRDKEGERESGKK